MLPYLLLLIILPFGIGLQSLALFVFTLWVLIQKRKELGEGWKGVGGAEKRSFLILTAVIGMQVLATFLNPKNPETDVVSFALGFLPLVVVPGLFTLLPSLKPEQKDQLEKIFAFVMGFWAIVVVSQNVVGWKISGTSIVTGIQYTRAQGFYSHPLTLAYVALMLWPAILVRFSQNFKDPRRVLALVANLVLLYYSASRTAQAVALLLTLAFVIWSFRGRVRALILGALTVGILAVLLTPNVVSQRFLRMTTQISEEKESGFADDRIAFWVVHSNMVKERPLLGHGINLDREYRLPYYEAIGLPDFKKAYEAHNQILQLAAEGGVICALAFVLWLVSLHFNGKSSPLWMRRARDLTILGLFLGGMTQNAYFDGEVRYALVLLLGLFFAQMKASAQKPII